MMSNITKKNIISKLILSSFFLTAAACKSTVSTDQDISSSEISGGAVPDPNPTPLTPPVIPPLPDPITPPTPDPITPPTPDPITPPTPDPITPPTPDPITPPTPGPTNPGISPTSSAKAASRFLSQATFGPNSTEIQALENGDISQWLVDQLETSPTLHLPSLRIQAEAGVDIRSHFASDSFWEAAVTAPDQLRQRMAFALSQILVASDDFSSDLRNQPLAMAYYMDILTRGSFGNYRDLLEEITYSPAMALYLTYMRNKKADPATGRLPDENYAREIMQLFSIGLVELNIDGTPKAGQPETYTIDDIVGLAKVFTGLSEKGGYSRGQADPDGFYAPLAIFPEFHSMEEKKFLGTTIPAGTGAAQSIDIALDTLFTHPNVGPFIGRQLIQRFVTSDPSPAYVGRVARTFNSGSYTLPDGRSVGEARRGDLAATLAAVLLDSEARQPSNQISSDFGKLREPVLRFVHWARAFNVKNAKAGEKRALRNTSSPLQLTQHPFRAASVFNFYRPGFVTAGSDTVSNTLNAPEFQIVNESSIVGYANFMSSFVRDNASNINGASGDAFSPVYTEELLLADNPEALIDRIDLLLTYGDMGAVEKQRIIEILNEMPIRNDENAEEDRERRVHMAVQLTVTSAAYSIQK